jgi:hypothetical protein
MPYIYQTTFDINVSDVDQLQIGRSVQLSLAYLKTFLANEPGFINARAMYSLAQNDLILVAIETTWEDWDYLDQHLNQSPFAEDKMLNRFELKITPLNQAHQIFEEIA